MDKDWDKNLFSKDIIEYMKLIKKDEPHCFIIYQGSNSTSLMFKSASELEFLLESISQAYQNGMYYSSGTTIEIYKYEDMKKVASYEENWKGDVCWFFVIGKRLKGE